MGNYCFLLFKSNTFNLILTYSSELNYIRLWNKAPTHDLVTIQQNLTSSLLLTSEISNTTSDDSSEGLNRHVIGKSTEIVNKSFGFFNDDMTIKTNEQ